MTRQNSHLATQLVAASPVPAARQRPVVGPIVQSTTFFIDDELNAAMDAGDYRTQYLYTRMANPTIDELAGRLAALHHAEDCVVTASGAAAVACALIELTRPGDVVLADTQLYGVTMSFLRQYLSAMGRTVEYVDFRDDAARSSAIARLRPQLVYAETISNPLLFCADLPSICSDARAVGALVVVDNTFANPALCRPLELGADVVIESLSKSISGHSDVHGGAVLGSNALIQRVWGAMIHLGGCIDPHAAWLITRGLKTLALRTEKMTSNAANIAAWLGFQPEIERVYFPENLPEGLSAAGTMVSFVVRGGFDRASRLLSALKTIAPATSLGGVESLASLPWNTSHRTDEARSRIGLLPGTVRLSLGCEDAGDLRGDLAQALEASGGGA